MEYNKHLNGTNCEIVLKGKLTFSDHGIFREVSPLFAQKKITNLVIDYSNVEFIDSAALGIMLLMRDEAGKENVSLTLKNPTGQVQKMFKIAKFYELFHIVDAS